MGRWQPDARGRLEQAAMDLYEERGFERTTVAEIVERAGLTERTFFRHYADKRDVLFAGAGLLQELLVGAVEGAPEALSPIEAAAVGLDEVASLLGQRRDFSQRRQAIIAASAELQERELIKLATLSAALAETLRGRGLGEPAASLTAELAMAVFRVAFERWIEETEERSLEHLMRDTLDELRTLTAVG
jgi:AcrR family transcriptional regulator